MRETSQDPVLDVRDGVVAGWWGRAENRQRPAPPPARLSTVPGVVDLAEGGPSRRGTLRLDGRPVVVTYLDGADLPGWLPEVVLAKRELLIEAGRHPHALDVIDIGRDANRRPYLVVEHCRLGELALITRKTGTTHWAEAVNLVIDAAGAVEHAHRKGLRHGNIRPSVISLADDGTPRVGGFDVLGSVQLLVQGDPDWYEYVAPEQRATGRASVAADVWALGAVAVFAITGRWPAGDRGAGAELAAAGAPGGVVAVITSALAAPAQRVSSAAGFAQALSAALVDDVRQSLARRAPEPQDASPAGQTAAVAPASDRLASTFAVWLDAALDETALDTSALDASRVKPARESIAAHAARPRAKAARRARRERRARGQHAAKRRQLPARANASSSRRRRFVLALAALSMLAGVVAGAAVLRPKLGPSAGEPAATTTPSVTADARP